MKILTSVILFGVVLQGCNGIFWNLFPQPQNESGCEEYRDEINELINSGITLPRLMQLKISLAECILQILTGNLPVTKATPTTGTSGTTVRTETPVTTKSPVSGPSMTAAPAAQSSTPQTSTTPSASPSPTSTASTSR